MKSSVQKLICRVIFAYFQLHCVFLKCMVKLTNVFIWCIFTGKPLLNEALCCNLSGTPSSIQLVSNPLLFLFVFDMQTSIRVYMVHSYIKTN